MEFIGLIIIFIAGIWYGLNSTPDSFGGNPGSKHYYPDDEEKEAEES